MLTVLAGLAGQAEHMGFYDVLARGTRTGQIIKRKQRRCSNESADCRLPFAECQSPSSSSPAANESLVISANHPALARLQPMSH